MKKTLSSTKYAPRIKKPIMKAKKKEVIEINPDELNVDFKPRLKTLKVKSPEERGGNVKMLSDAEDLVKTLRDKEGLI